MSINETKKLTHAEYLLKHLEKLKKSTEEREEKIKNARKISITDPFYEIFNPEAKKIYKKLRVPSILENYNKYLFGGTYIDLDKFVSIDLRKVRNKRGG